MTEALKRVAELVQQECGLQIKAHQYPSLRAAIARAVPSADPAAFLRLAGDPVRGPGTLARLVDEVTIKETSFFRDRRQLEAIAWHLLLDRARAGGSGTVRVWSAACATGQEAYTLAMLASEAFAPGPAPVHVLGTDIAASALATAASGRYVARRLRGIGQHERRRYFTEDGDDVVVSEALRDLVEFAPHNLARDPIPPPRTGAFDLIVCRNVLIYFDGETVEQVIHSLEGALRPGGMLVLGSADALCGTARRLARLADPSPPPRRVAPGRSLRRPLGRLEPVQAPLDADAYFLAGIRHLDADEAADAVRALRRSLYVDPTFALAAFMLGRAHELLGDERAARRAYEQALRTLDLADDRHDHLLEQVDLEDIAGACRARLEALG